MVTNNEVSEAEAKVLMKQGIKPSDEEWEKLGIARYVTWPRTVCSIEGHDVNGNPLKGNYLGSNIPMADGFKTNAAYFKLGFLDKASIRIGTPILNTYNCHSPSQRIAVKQDVTFSIACAGCLPSISANMPNGYSPTHSTPNVEKCTWAPLSTWPKRRE